MTPRGALVAGLLLLAATVGLGVVRRSRAAAGAPPATVAPMEDELFGEGVFDGGTSKVDPQRAESPCAAGSDEERRRWAELAEVKGRARGERYPFHGASGAWAARLWSEASVCWRAADAQERARFAEEQRDVWRNRVLRDVRAQRLRLERAMKNKQQSQALAEIKALRAFFEGGPARVPVDGSGPAPRYSDWLLREARRLEAHSAP